MWIVDIALKRPYTFIVLALLILMISLLAIMLVNMLIVVNFQSWLEPFIIIAVATLFFVPAVFSLMHRSRTVSDG